MIDEVYNYKLENDKDRLYAELKQNIDRLCLGGKERDEAIKYACDTICY